MRFNNLTTPQWYFVLFPVFAELQPLNLILYSEQHVQTALTTLKNTPLYNEVLQLGWLKCKEGEQKDPVASTLGATSSASKVGSVPPAKRPRQSLQTRKGQKALKPGEVKPGRCSTCIMPASPSN